MKWFWAFAAVLLFLTTHPARAQTPLWESYLHTTSRVETSYETTKKDSMGFLLAGGSVNSHPSIRKIAPDGSLLWERSLPLGSKTVGIRFDPDDNVYATTVVPNSVSDPVGLTKLRASDGIVLWSVDLHKRYGFSNTVAVFPFDSTSMLVVGNHIFPTFAHIVRIATSDGRTQAKKAFTSLSFTPYNNDTVSQFAVQAANGDVIVQAFSRSKRLIRFHFPDISVVWNKAMPQYGGQQITANGMLLAGDDSLILTVDTGDEKTVLTNVDATSGIYRWQTVQGGLLHSFIVDHDGNLAAVGSTIASATLIKFSSADGHRLWSASLNSAAAGPVAASADGYLYAVLTNFGTNSVGLAKVDSKSGSVIYSVQGAVSPTYNEPHTVEVTSAGTVAVFGMRYSFTSTATTWWFDGSDGHMLRMDGNEASELATINPIRSLSVGTGVILAGWFYDGGWALERLSTDGEVVWKKIVRNPDRSLWWPYYRFSNDSLRQIAYAQGADGKNAIFAAGNLGASSMVMRIDAETGRTLWSVDLYARMSLFNVHNVAALPNGDAMVFGSLGPDTREWILRLRHTDGKVLWWHANPQLDWTDTLQDNSHVVVGTAPGDVLVGQFGTIYRISAENGSTVWGVNVPFYWDSDMGELFTDPDGNAYPMSGTVIAKIDYTTGQVVYTKSYNAPDWGLRLSPMTLLPNGVGTWLEAHTNGSVFLRAIHLSDGSEAWFADLSGLLNEDHEVRSYLTYTNGTIFLNVNVGTQALHYWVTSAFDAVRKQQLWTSTPYFGGSASDILPLTDGTAVAVGGVPFKQGQALRAARYGR